MRKILVLFAHPVEHKSRVNVKMINTIKGLDNVTVHNLYENYANFYIDVKKEQALLSEHDVIIWHHPFYWYSAPAIIKEWFDLVLEHGFAYGKDGEALKGKWALNAITTGGREESYQSGGLNRYSLHQYLLPFDQAAYLCKMDYLPPFVIHGVHLLEEDDIERVANDYKSVILALRDEEIRPEDFPKDAYLNDVIV